MIVGEAGNSAADQDGFRWTQATGVQFLGAANDGTASDISDLGRIVGTENILFARLAYTWRNGVLADLTGLIGGDRDAKAVNRCGTIVGLEFGAVALRAVRWIARACDV